MQWERHQKRQAMPIGRGEGTKKLDSKLCNDYGHFLIQGHSLLLPKVTWRICSKVYVLFIYLFLGGEDLFIYLMVYIYNTMYPFEDYYFGKLENIYIALSIFL